MDRATVDQPSVVLALYFGKVANRRSEQNSILLDLNLDYIEKYYKTENFTQKQVHRHLVIGA